MQNFPTPQAIHMTTMKHEKLILGNQAEYHLEEIIRDKLEIRWNVNNKLIRWNGKIRCTKKLEASVFE